MQVQKGKPSLSSQTPSFKQGFGLHGSISKKEGFTFTRVYLQGKYCLYAMFWIFRYNINYYCNMINMNFTADTVQIKMIHRINCKKKRKGFQMNLRPHFNPLNPSGHVQ